MRAWLGSAPSRSVQLQVDCLQRLHSSTASVAGCLDGFTALNTVTSVRIIRFHLFRR